VPILHYYGLEDYTMAKRYSFQLCFSKEIKWDVEEFLKDTFPRKKQIILAPYHGGNSLAPYHGRISFFLDNISFVPRTRNLLPQFWRTFRQGILQPKLSFPYFVFSFNVIVFFYFFFLFFYLFIIIIIIIIIITILFIYLFILPLFIRTPYYTYYTCSTTYPPPPLLIILIHYLYTLLPLVSI
jgi:hypothetical protein